MDVITAQVIAMLTLGFGSFISGMIPAYFSEDTRRRHPLLLSCLLCFGGGVLLSTSLAHMLPEARERYPIHSELMLCIGFFLVYLVDEIVHMFYRKEPGYHERTSYGSEGTSLLCDRDDEMRQGDRCCETDNARTCHVSHTVPCNKSSSGTIGLLCALFVHSILEGLAIGLQESASQVLLLLGAVSSHKYVVGFCLGAELCESGPGKICSHIACMAIFSAGSVVGIGLGVGLENVSAMKDSVIVPIMQALAAGTLLYVTVSEVLPRERARWHERKRCAGFAQFVAVCAGFTVMYLTTMYLDYDA